MPIPDTIKLRETTPAWSFQDGWTVVAVFAGVATESELVSAIQDWMNSGATHIRPRKQVIGQSDDGLEYLYEVTIEVQYAATGVDGAPADPADPDYGLFSRSWELDWNDDQIPLREADVLSPLAAAPYEMLLPALDVAANRYAEDLSSYITAVAGGGSGTQPDVASYLGAVLPDGLSTEQAALATWYFRRVAADENASHVAKRPVLRKTEIVAAYANLAASNVNAERFYSYAGFTALEGSVESAQLVSAAELNDLYWQKQRPGVASASYGRWQIVQEYWGFKAYDQVQYLAPVA